MKKFCFCPHPSSNNHGCEAIAISSYYILKKHIPDAESTLLSRFPKGSPRRGCELAYDLYEKELNVIMPHIRRYSYEWFKYQFSKIMGKDRALIILSKEFQCKQGDLLAEQDVFVSIGGDNYCYGRPISYYAVNKVVQDYGKKSILWGCSIEPSAITEEMLADLCRYNKIVTRESLTYDALVSKGLTNVKLYPDPAFTLEPTLYEGVKENTVGINISPLILDYAGEKAEKAFNAYKRMMKYILEQTDCNIALIPHVTEPTTDDRSVLKKLYEKINDKDRITVYDDMDCQQLKSIISQCRFFIGARTHATIAAYSTCVPTLVCGYSVKAKGIAKDLFGTYDNYVVPVQSIDREDMLEKAFQWIYKNENMIRTHLQEIMPAYIQKAWEAGKEFVDVAK